MVVLSAAICTKSGKALVARQFVDMTRIRIEGLLSAFPKLITSGKQHTFIETEHVRYVYQPMETLYLLLVTNKQSNIIEDLETLRFLAKVVPDIAGGIDEESISHKAFELVFAFDEVITLGYRENITIKALKTNLEMDSAEEKLQLIILKTKMDEARDTMRRRAEAIDKQKEKERAAGITRPMDAVSSASYSGMGSTASSFTPSNTSAELYSNRNTPTAASKPAASSTQRSSKPVKGMSLGASKKQDQFLDAMKSEGEFTEQDLQNLSISGASSASAASAQLAVADMQGVHLDLEEKMQVKLSSDGTMGRLDIKGDMNLTVNDPNSARVEIHIDNSQCPREFQFKAHPNINKTMFAENQILCLKDPSRAYPIGRSNSVGILKWRMATSDDQLIPITVNCWPNPTDGMSVMNLEYELVHPIVLNHVTISIPCRDTNAAPTVNQIDGRYVYDAANRVMQWHIDSITPDQPSGSLEFSVPEVDNSSFFPIQVDFTSEYLYSRLTVTSAKLVENSADVQFSTSSKLGVEQYVISAD